MKQEKYTQIKEYLRNVIKGTEWEGYVFSEGGCVYDEIMEQEIRGLFDVMLTSQHPMMAMELLRKTGAMHYFIPELEETYDMEQKGYHFGTVWEHTIAVMEQLKSNKLELRMAALLHDIGKVRTQTETNGKVHFLKHDVVGAEMVDEVLRPLRYGNEFIREVTFLVENHMLSKSWGKECEHMKDKTLRKWQYLCGTEKRFRDLMLLIDADNNAHAPEHCMPHQVEMILRRTEEMKAEGTAMFGYKLPLNGKEVMALKGIEPGTAVKECLDYLLKLAFVNPLKDRDEVIKHLKGYKLNK